MPAGRRKLDTPRYCQHCGTELPEPPGRGRSVYCRPPKECAAEARRKQVRRAVQRFVGVLPEETRKATQNARKFISRHGLTRDKVLSGPSGLILGTLLESRPDALSERGEDLWRNILLTRRLWLQGREDQARSAAVALRAIASEERGQGALRARTLCEELIRDAGARSFESVAARAHRVVELWAAQREWPQLAAALLTSANLHRTRINLAPDRSYRKAFELVQGAYHVASGLSRKADPDLVKILRHQALLWRLRLVVTHLRERPTAGIGSDLEQLQRLAVEIDRPRVRFETFLEEVGYLTIWGDLERAEERLDKAKALVGSLSRPLTRIRLLRAEIELLFAAGRRYEAIDRIAEYISVWKTHPDAYHLRHLEGWKDQVPPEVIEEAYRVPPRPVFLGAGIPGLYFEDRLAEI